MSRLVIGLVLIAHGLIHLIGFVVAWTIATLEGFPYRTDFLSNVEIGPAGVKVLELFWLLAAMGFVIVGIALIARLDWWWRA